MPLPSVTVPVVVPDVVTLNVRPGGTKEAVTLRAASIVTVHIGLVPAETQSPPQPPNEPVLALAVSVTIVLYASLLVQVLPGGEAEAHVPTLPVENATVPEPAPVLVAVKTRS